MKFFRSLKITLYLHIPIAILVWSEWGQIADRSALSDQGQMGQLFFLFAFIITWQSMYQGLANRSGRGASTWASHKSNIQEELPDEPDDLDEAYVSWLPMRIGIAFYAAHLVSLKVISVIGWPIIFIIGWPFLFSTALITLGVAVTGSGGDTSSAGFSLGGDGGGGGE